MRGSFVEGRNDKCGFILLLKCVVKMLSYLGKALES